MGNIEISQIKLSMSVAEIDVTRVDIVIGGSKKLTCSATRKSSAVSPNKI